MQFLGVAVLIFASVIWILGGRAIMRPQLRRPKPQSLISMLRPDPISFKDFTQTQKRRLIWLLFTTALLGLLGLWLLG
jgi:hypothetical protein